MGWFRNRRRRPRELRHIGIGDSFTRAELNAGDLDFETREPDPYPEGQVDEPYEGMTTKTPERWVRTDDPATWRDRSGANV